ncbi:META domain-containing protein [Poseidonocella sp. HB161398]|uniref:META domain-containing protein n=1 Tax=Poseidonocella sp. HB161398 TaxID=2320855 RepID=UPI001486AC32|nr:META domain-containing protein [Poseidonocella sp. HB161398]
MRYLVLSAALAAAPMAMAQTQPDPETEFRLEEMDGAPYEGDVTLVFPEEERIAGQGPCNRFMGRVVWDGESMSIGPLVATMMACPNLDAEKTLLKALEAVETGVLTGDELLLTTSEGGTLLYRADAAPE